MLLAVLAPIPGSASKSDADAVLMLTTVSGGLGAACPRSLVWPGAAADGIAPSMNTTATIDRTVRNIESSLCNRDPGRYGNPAGRSSPTSLSDKARVTRPRARQTPEQTNPRRGWNL